MPVPPSILDLTKRRDELGRLLAGWCNQNSGSENLPGLAAMLERLHEAFASLPGARVERVALAGTTARALQVRVRPEAPVQVFCSGHFDTVYGPGHAFQQCDQPAPDRLRGPGTADMKGGLVVLLAALQAFEQTPQAANVGYEVLLGPDEETGSQGTAPLLASAARRHRLGLVFEPARANGDLVKSRKGTGTFTLACHGRAAHAGRDPGAGRNAILALCALLPRLDALAAELPGLLVNVGAIRGGGAPNIVPDFAEAAVNVRVTGAGDDTRFRRRLDEICAPLQAREGYRLEIGGGFNRGPKVETPAEIALFGDWRKCGAEFGLALDWQHVGGGSDGNLLSAAGLPNLDGLGCVGDHLHSPEEYCVLSSLPQRAQVAALFLHRLAAGEIPPPGS
ncbi:MAG: hydrolase [Opitutaceae bacterium]|nr:hydrolase [Opitutaceae bacterium]